MGTSKSQVVGEGMLSWQRGFLTCSTGQFKKAVQMALFDTARI
jgi:hypothetical protein